MKKIFLAPVLLAVFLCLMLLSPFALAQKGGKGKGGQGGPDFPNGNCGSCASRAYSTCVNQPTAEAQCACWEAEFTNGCGAHFNCTNIQNPFACGL